MMRGIPGELWPGMDGAVGDLMSRPLERASTGMMQDGEDGKGCLPDGVLFRFLPQVLVFHPAKAKSLQLAGGSGLKKQG